MRYSKPSRTPASPESAVLLKAHFTEKILQRVLGDLATLEDRTVFAANGTQTFLQIVVILDEPKFMDDTQLRVSITTCRVDAGVVFVPGANGGTDVVVNDTVAAGYGDRQSFYFEDGAWQAGGRH
ncbi:hypothetical protein [uncultured Ilumatobacter sp.]|uniref:hypothetical protein n=1 Tax=uncultured Ilumatobacter sp. TaxID=879968 RepID=UPI00374EEB64